MNKSYRVIGIVILLCLAQIACATSSLAGGSNQNQAKDEQIKATQAAATQTAQATGSPQVTLTAKNDPHLGLILADQKGLTLYTYQQDQPGTSNCDSACAQTWPPATIPNGTQPTHATGVNGLVGTLRRTDGSLQVTYNQLPLYRYSGDATPQDARGEGIDGSWDVVAVR